MINVDNYYYRLQWDSRAKSARRKIILRIWGLKSALERRYGKAFEHVTRGAGSEYYLATPPNLP